MNRLRPHLRVVTPKKVIITCVVIAFSLAVIIAVAAYQFDTKSLTRGISESAPSVTPNEVSDKQVSLTPNTSVPQPVQNDSSSNTTPHATNRRANTTTTPTQNIATTPPLEPLSSIVITGGDDALVRFKTTGLSTSGYLVTWRQINYTTPSHVADGQNADVFVYQPEPQVHVGSGKVFHLKYAFGTYIIHLCENKGNQCGVRSNPIYLTVAPIQTCTDEIYGQQCIIVGNKMTYSF